jgi:hypothetical protein
MHSLLLTKENLQTRIKPVSNDSVRHIRCQNTHTAGGAGLDPAARKHVFPTYLPLDHLPPSTHRLLLSLILYILELSVVNFPISGPSSFYRLRNQSPLLRQTGSSYIRSSSSGWPIHRLAENASTTYFQCREVKPWPPRSLTPTLDSRELLGIEYGGAAQSTQRCAHFRRCSAE